MIDIDNGRIVDILESRETNDVAKWLASYPNIRVVSRDGSQQYAAAIRQAHPGAIQVSDRFHLVKNLTDYAKQCISKIVSANFRIPSEEGEPGTNGGYWEKPACHGADLPEREHVANTEKKRKVVEKVRALAEQGLTMTEVARESGVSVATAKKYSQAGFDPANMDFGSKRISKLKPYTDKIDEMLRKRRKFKDIEAAIRKDGYDGADSTIRMYATRQRRLMKAAIAGSHEGTELIERKWVTKLLYQPIEKIKELTKAQVGKIIREYPVIGTLYYTVQSFKEILFAKHVNEIDGWIATASKLDITEINSFINGIIPDLDAVKNAIRFEYNNGLAEGSVNKLKLVKRIMYGRCSFTLLRGKMLLKEFFTNIN